MNKERIAELKNISNRRGMFTEATICECLDEAVDAIERLQFSISDLSSTLASRELDLDHFKRESQRLTADKQRMADEIYRLVKEVDELTQTIARAKDAHANPGEAYNDEQTANRMLDVLEGKP